MQLQTIDENTPAIPINWFRRVAKFYPEFMLSDRPTIIVTTNPRFTDLIADLSRPLWRQLAYANTDMLAFGAGIIVSAPDDPMQFLRYPPDQHYEVRDNGSGALLGDIVYNLRGVVGDDNAQIDIVEYPIAGNPVKRTHRFKAGIVSELVRTVKLPPRTGRQVIVLDFDADRTSIFDDMKHSVGEISRALTAHATTIFRNARPHLFGPEGAVTINAEGAAELNIQGMYFPLSEGDVEPGYLQWDTKSDAVRLDIELQLDTALNMASLNKLLFDPQTTGNLSGVALRRLLLPFVAKLNTLKEINDMAILDVLATFNQNIRDNGGELFAYNLRDVEITYHFEEVFSDEVVVDENAGDGEGEGEPS